MFKCSLKIGNAEKKIIVVFSYYLVLEVVALASLVLNLMANEKFTNVLTYYFTCERIMPGSCECFRKAALKLTFSGVSNATNILFALYPLVNLVYAFNFMELKGITSRYLQRRFAVTKTDTSESTNDKATSI